MNKFTITPETIAKANKYMPISDKYTNAKAIALACVESPGEGKTAKVDNRVKTILLISNLLSFYLNVEIGENGSVTEEIFDEYAASRPIQQLERLKHTDSCKAAIYDILSDYHEFKTMVEAEITALKEEYNDPIARLLSALSFITSAENVKKMMSEHQTTAKEYTETLEQKGIIKGGEKDAES